MNISPRNRKSPSPRAQKASCHTAESSSPANTSLWKSSIRHVEVPSWEDVQHGDKLRTIYFINLENEDGKKWTVYKTYTMFASLHERMKSKSLMVKLFKFPNKSKFNTHAEWTKERRRSGFQEYTQLLTQTLSPIPDDVIEFFTPQTWELSGYEEAKRKLSFDKELPGEEVTQKDMEGLLEEAAWGNVQKLMALLRKGVDVSFSDAKQRTALHRAAWDGRQKACELLLEFDAPIDAQDHKGRTPLYNACFKLHLNTAKVLLDAGANMDIEAVDFTKPGEKFTDNLLASDDKKESIRELLNTEKLKLQEAESATIITLQEELVSKNSQLQRLENELNQAKLLTDEHKKESETLRNESEAALKETKEMLNAVTEELRQSMKNYQEKVEREKLQQQKLEALQSQIKSHSSAVEQIHTEKAQFAEKLASAEQALEQTRTDLARQERVLAEKDQALALLHAAHEAALDGSITRDAASGELTVKKEVLDKLEQDYASLLALYKASQELVKTLEAELESTLRKLKLLEADYKKIADEKTNVDTDLILAQAHLKNKEDKLKEVSNEKDAFGQELKHMETTLKATRKLLEEKEKAMEEKHKEVEEHVVQIERIKRRASVSNEEQQQELYEKWSKAEEQIYAQWEEAEQNLIEEIDHTEKRLKNEILESQLGSYIMVSIFMMIIMMSETNVSIPF